MKSKRPTDFFQDIDSVPLDEFLLWLKRRTEVDWREHATVSFEAFQKRGCYQGSDWKKGTKWLSDFDEGDIYEAEQKWGVRFPPDYRQFLVLLGAPDQHLFGVQCVDNKLVREDVPFFYNWRIDSSYLEQALRWPLEALLSDVAQGKWYESWGTRPNSLEDRQELVKELVAAAPPLIPLTTRKSFLIGTPMQEDNPVISIDLSFFQDELEISLNANNFRNFLLLELSEFLNINRMKAWEHATNNVDQNLIRKIPFWGEFILSRWEE